MVRENAMEAQDIRVTMKQNVAGDNSFFGKAAKGNKEEETLGSVFARFYGQNTHFEPS